MSNGNGQRAPVAQMPFDGSEEADKPTVPIFDRLLICTDSGYRSKSLPDLILLGKKATKDATVAKKKEPKTVSFQAGTIFMVTKEIPEIYRFPYAQ